MIKNIVFDFGGVLVDWDPRYFYRKIFATEQEVEHFVTEVCDGGPIILQKSVAVENGDTPETLQKRIMEQAEWKILPEAVSLFCQDKIEIVDGKAVIKK